MAQIEQEIHFCTTADSVRIAYATAGQGPPLVKAANWLNHLEFDWRSPIWNHMLEEFTRDHLLVRYDERGTGLSDWSADELTFEAFVNDLEAVVDAVGLTRFPVLGISQGGPVAIAYAARHPERVSHLILYGSYARGWAKRGSPVDEIERRQAYLTLTKLGWGKDHPAYRQLWTSLFVPDGTLEQWHWFNDLQRESASADNAFRILNEVGTIDVVDLLPQLKVPTLVMHCRDDAVSPFEEGRLLASSILGARFIPLEGRNHLLLESDPAWPRFVSEVRRFLGSSTPPMSSKPAASQLSYSEGKHLTVGGRLGRYKIKSLLGAGGMGQVYLAEDSQLRRSVALKVLPGDLASNTDRMRRFVQEAQAAAALNHPNIAHIYEIGEEDGVHLIAMEFVDGQTLRQKIHRDHTDLRKLLRYLQQVAEGLAKAHAAGIVHRDLKPDNIMISRDGYAKILDFGLAKLVEPTITMGQQAAGDEGLSEVATAVMPQHSLPGTIMGTVGYMSPEQAQGKVNEIDHRSDIFSFGCILFEAATGRKAFEGKDALDSLHNIVHAPTPQIKDLNPVAPAELQRIVRRCLAKDPEKRYQSIKDVAIELEELRQELKAGPEQEYSVAPATSDSSAFGGAMESAVDSRSRPTQRTATAEGTHSSSSAEYIVSEIKRHKFGAVLVVAVSVIALVGLGFALYKFLGSKRAPNLQAMKMTRLTNNGRVGSASISPDGKYVVYSARDEAGLSSLWVRHVATTSNVQVVPSEGPDVIFGQSTFSPDGNYIYYLRSERGRAPGVLYQVPVLGGTSKKLLENVSRISFSPDGKRFAFNRRYASEGEDTVMIANADGTGELKLAVRKHPDFFLPGTAWSPDGQTIACPAGGFTGGYYRSVAVINISDGAQKILTPRKWFAVERLAWLPDSSGVITTAQERAGDQYQLWQISFPEGEARTLTNDLSDYHLVSLTADAGALVSVVSDTTSNIWLVPNGEWSNGRQLTSSKSNGIASTALLSDGRIIFQSRAGGNSDLWIMDADGRNQKQLTDDVHSETYASATPDGRYVVFGSARPGTQIWRTDIDGGNAKLLTDSPGFNPTISPDGKWVVYTTFGPGGFSIWKVSIDGGEPVQITNKYSLSPAISPDGKLIACYYLDERTRTQKIALIPSAGGEPLKIFESPPADAGNLPVRWTHDGRALTYIVNRGGVSNIWIQPLDGGPPTQLTDFKTDRIFAFDWSRDGKWLALSRGPEQRDVVLMSDFR